MRVALCVVLLLAIVFSARAEGTVTGTQQQVRKYSNQSASTAYVYPDPITACQALSVSFVRQVASWQNETTFKNVRYSSTTNQAGNNGVCVWVADPLTNGSTPTVNLQWSSALVTETVCPSHATGGGQSTACTCEAGYKPDATATSCVPDCTPGEVAGSGYFRQGSDPGKLAAVACVGVCEVVFDGFTGMGSTLEDGAKVWYALGQYIKTGSACAGGTSGMPSNPPAVPPPDCAEGQVLGEINGKPVCANGGTGDPVVPSQTETTTTTKGPPVDNGDGTTTETETTTRTGTNPDGSTGTQTTTTTTTCDQLGNCETTTETETEGSFVDPEADPEEQPSECELNPTAAGCAELDVPNGPDLPTSNVSISGVVPQTGWGADNGTCPALVHTVSLGDVDVFGLMCTYMAGIRFLVIGMAWLIAALIFIGRTD